MSYSSLLAGQQMSIDDAFYHGQNLTETDQKRLRGDLKKVFDAMSDGKWYSPDELSRISGVRIDSALRHWRRLRELGFECNMKPMGGGLNLYQVIS